MVRTMQRQVFEKGSMRKDYIFLKTQYSRRSQSNYSIDRINRIQNSIDRINQNSIEFTFFFSLIEFDWIRLPQIIRLIRLIRMSSITIRLSSITIRLGSIIIRLSSIKVIKLYKTFDLITSNCLILTHSKPLEAGGTRVAS